MMLPVYTELFYNRKDIFQQNPNALSDILGPWMLTRDSKFMKSDIEEKKKKEENQSDKSDKSLALELLIENMSIKSLDKPIEKPLKTKFYPRHPDSLFWCMYVANHSQSVYERNIAIGTNMINLMMSEKRKLFEYFNGAASSELKQTNHKITNIKLNEIKSNLMTQPSLASSLLSLIPCCVYWRRPIYVDLGDNCYLHFVRNDYVADNDGTDNNDSTDNDDSNDGDNTILLYVNKGSYSMETSFDVRRSHIAHMREVYYKFINVEKAICGIGAYKTDELTEIYNKLFGPATDKMTKQAMYEKIGGLCGKKLTDKLR